MKQLIVQIHRGGGAAAPENTLDSFLPTWEIGAIPEADVRTTSDGVIVAFHDKDFARVVKNADAELAAKGVKDVTWGELQALDVGLFRGAQFAGQRVAGISEIFAHMRGYPDRRLYLDIKDVDLPALAKLVTEFEVVEQTVFAGPKEQALQEWRRLLPGAQTLLWMGILRAGDEDTLWDRIQTLRESDFDGVTQLQIHVEAVQQDGIWQFKPSLEFLSRVAAELKAHDVLFQALPWECNIPEVYSTLLAAGAKSFATDYLEVARYLLRVTAESQSLSLEEALQSARETRVLKIGENILPQTSHIFREQFGGQPAIVIADATTFQIAGREVQAALQRDNRPCMEPFIYTDPALYAESSYVEQLEKALVQHDVIPIAVGSGVINDVVKLAAHRVGRPYLCVATAASMDGYTAFGASISHEGSKQTFTCPAPVAVVADLEIIRNAPKPMTASGYADLMAKVTAGADWIVADALGVELIDPTAWNIAQGKLRAALDNPQDIATGEVNAISRLTEGLMLGGFAMQWMKTSRPASGAEHQFSHLWDMQHHTHNGIAPSHGFKVGVGTLAVTALYEYLLEQPLEDLDIERCCRQWPDAGQISFNAHEILDGELAELGECETLAKFIPVDELRTQLETLKRAWPALKQRLKAQLIPFDEAQEMLRIVGAPSEPEQIGISRARLRQSFRQAALIRRRFTVLDLALRTNTLDAALDHLFGEAGRWPMEAGV